MKALAMVLGVVVVAAVAGAAEREFRIAEPFGLEWGPDRVSFDVAFEKGEVIGDAVVSDQWSVVSGDEAVAAQLDGVTLWEDGSVRSAKVVFMASLAADEVRTFTLNVGADLCVRPGEHTGSPLRVPVSVTEADGVIEMSNGLTGIRVPAGGREDFPAPIVGVRLPGGAWMGKGWWKTEAQGVGYTSVVEAAGPVFARVRLTYSFVEADGRTPQRKSDDDPSPVRTYAAVVELYAGQDLAIVTEAYNVSEGKGIAMGGVPGMKEDTLYRYVLPQFASEEAELAWDWWGQTHSRLPAPDAYAFSLSEGLSPDSAAFEGYNMFGHLKEGDGGLTFDKHGRFLYLNAYLQWGDEESTYVGLWNAASPSEQVAVVALKPGEWIHPD
ncbi:MAG: hypothetical protein FWF84_04140, partial [Kiritimatiellaeota bacterium]|nr:hypothetical protein [Kiritimatiellota bacterium]